MTSGPMNPPMNERRTRSRDFLLILIFFISCFKDNESQIPIYYFINITGILLTLERELKFNYGGHDT